MMAILVQIGLKRSVPRKKPENIGYCRRY
ncbi:hypothetical protein Godav_014888 [Gossypium davidsonii]|uniref:Uncharacterized protein n=1 Tax=Gossypium davidsonii TaxID=34287 RepID=A0A7J8RL84_GOSDV|nr:hypothetical protein [Gossypium davidsonii]